MRFHIGFSKLIRRRVCQVAPARLFQSEVEFRAIDTMKCLQTHVNETPVLCLP